MHTIIVTTRLKSFARSAYVLLHVKVIRFDNAIALPRFVTEFYCIEFLCKWILNLNEKEWFWFSVVFQSLIFKSFLSN